MPGREKKFMVNTVPATKARIHFGEILKRVHSGREQLIIERDGLPIAAIVSYADYERYRESLALSHLSQLSRMVSEEIKKKGWTEEEVFKSVEEAQEEAFKERYGKSPTSRRRKAR
jgi:prevent-host-death family protein